MLHTNTNSTLPWLILAAFTCLAMAILQGNGTRVRPDGVRTEATDDPRQRGRDYEAHVFTDERLPHLVQREGGRLQLHPRIRPPIVSVPALYYQVPQGFDHGVLPDPRPHASAIKTWASRLKAPYRVPDAIAVFPGGVEVLHELKCASPWLAFDSGSAWAGKMQAAFASQAVAFMAWAAARPEMRRVLYGFCGQIPPWAIAILDDLQGRFALADLEIQAVYFASDFEPGHRLVQRSVRDAMIAALDEMTPDALLGIAYDKLSD